MNISIKPYKFLLKEKGIDYWDFRFQKIKNTNILGWNNHIKKISRGTKEGYCVRVLYKNAFGFAYGNLNDDIRNTVKRAIRIAKLLSEETSMKTEIKEHHKINDYKKSSFKTDPNNIPLKEKIDFVVRNSRITNKVVKSMQLQYEESNIENLFENSENSLIKQDMTFTALRSVIVGKKGSRTESYSHGTGMMGGYEITKKYPAMYRDSLRILKDLFKAENIKGGRLDVIMDPRLASVFIHEALGHATESDLVLQNNSCLKNRLNTKIASDIVTVYDSPLGNEWGSYFYDDEGIPAGKTLLIEKGVLKNYLASRETAGKSGLKLTGNGRAQFTDNMPLVRMSNTFIKKGKNTREELIKNVKSGVLLNGTKGGQVNTSQGTFHFSAQYGYLIKNGKLGKPVKGVSLSGNIFKLLKNIIMISDKREYDFPGFCGKNAQQVPVNGRNPYVLVKDALVGGSE
ncbi:TldD/PmbA family protein [Candidatus Woesearchaeota archaeon]|nr:TldD/PmbA family protein [Candidatus Woesearchaeota archaeon]